MIVCDGFVGNVALKTSEGLVRLINTSLKESLKSTVTSQVGALLSRAAFQEFKKRLDYTEYGGAPLLGVRGVCTVGHGSSNEKAVMNGIRVTAEFAHAQVNSAIEAAIQRLVARDVPRDGAGSALDPMPPTLPNGQTGPRNSSSSILDEPVQ